MGKKTYIFVALMILAIGLRLMFLKPQPSNCPVSSRSDWEVPSWGYSTSPDSLSYLGYVRDIFRGENLINPTRTPVYPLFLAINFILFGYMNLQAIALSQFFLSIMSVALLYLIMLHLTKSPLVSFVTGFIFACDYKLMLYEPMILTEALTTFMVLVVVGAFLWAIYGKFATIKSVVLSLSILTLIFLRPNFIYMLALAPLVFALVAIHDKQIKPLMRFGASFVVIVIAPFLVWCFFMKSQYDFFGISNVGYIDLFGLTLEQGLYKQSLPKYSDIVKTIDTQMGTLTPEIRASPYSYLDGNIRKTTQTAALAGINPNHNVEDFSDLGMFSLSTIKRCPVKYSRIVANHFLVLFSYQGGLRIMTNILAGKSNDNASLSRKIIDQIQRSIIGRLLVIANKLFTLTVFLLFFIISVALLMPFLHDSFHSWLQWFIINSIAWGAILLVCCVTYGDFQRYRIPIDSLLAMMGCYFFHRILRVRE